MNTSSPDRSAPNTFLLALLGIGVAIGVGLFWVDDSVRIWVNATVYGGWLMAAHLIGKYCDWPLLMVVGGVLYGIFRWRGCADWQRIILVMMVGSTLAGLTVNASRLTTGRTRPSADIEQGWYGPYSDGKWNIGRHKMNSFPSGHTATAFGFFAPLVFMRVKIGVLLLCLPLAVALARIGTRSHHPSDVWWAIIVAMVWGWWLAKHYGPKPNVENAAIPNA